MYWQQEKDETGFVIPDKVIDLAFSIRCPILPIDHAQALSDEIRRILPWFPEEEGAGVHTIYGAESGNGWERPEGPESMIYISRRTKLVLRLPKPRVDDARALEGNKLEIAGHPLEVGESQVRPLSASTTLYARYVSFADSNDDEQAFMRRSIDELRSRRFKFKKILCGKAHVVATEAGPVMTRSLMVADLPLDEAVRLQEEGLGTLRQLGCGLFIAHKSV